MTPRHAAAAAILLLSACGETPVPPQADAPSATALESRGSAGGRAPVDRTAAPLPTDSWLGRWTGPEGLFLVIAPGSERGSYALTIKGDLDSAGERLDGIADGKVIRFVRGGVTETLRTTDGAGTGLKWLAGRTTCLVVKQGEGYCKA